VKNTKKKKEKKEYLIDVIHNKLFQTKSVATITKILVSLITLTVYIIPIFSQSEGTNLTIQDISKSTNQTIES
jgi:hypothetical protein